MNNQVINPVFSVKAAMLFVNGNYERERVRSPTILIPLNIFLPDGCLLLSSKRRGCQRHLVKCVFLKPQPVIYYAFFSYFAYLFFFPHPPTHTSHNFVEHVALRVELPGPT